MRRDPSKLPQKLTKKKVHTGILRTCSIFVVGRVLLLTVVRKFRLDELADIFESFPFPPLPQMMWPSVFDVHAYRRDVYNLVCEVIARAPADAISNMNMDSPYWALPMSMEHERIHIETSRCGSSRSERDIP